MALQAIVQPLLSWYAQHARDLPWRRHVTPYRVWVSEIMLQQTRVEAVKGYFARFLMQFPDIRALSEAPEQQLLKCWEGLGYYSRARNLQKAAKVVVEEYGGELPASYEALKRLPGIGPYTAGAIASIAFGLPVPAVDGNVLRVWARVTADRADIAAPRTRKQAAEALRAVMPAGACGTFNQALMELGALVCVPNAPPRCEACPLSGLCEGKRQGIAESLPVKKPKPARKVEARTVFLLEQAGRLALRRRPKTGLLAGLWELPAEAGTLSREEAVAAVRAWGLEPVQLWPLPPAKHVFTHVEWHMTGWRCKLAPENTAPFVWVTADELRETYPLPSAFRPFLEAWRAGDNAFSAEDF